MKLTRSFVAGKMNKSLDERLIQNGEYIDAMNIRVGSTETSDIGAVENTKGNEKITTLKYNGVALSSTAICIGAFDDGVNETIYWFVHSPDDGVDMIVSYNNKLNSVTYHIISTSVLNFNPDYLINGVDKIDNLLFFTDGYNPPRKINVTRSYPSEPNLKESDISVIVAPPSSSPSIQLLSITGQSDFIEDKFISFAYRYKYLDGEYSALSQFSDIAFEPGFFKFDFGASKNLGMKNSFNAVNVTFNSGGPNVIGIDLVYKTSTSPIVNVIEKYDKKKLGINDNAQVSKIFNSNKIFTTLPESELLRTFDNVPLKAKTQTMMGGRIFYGNYTDGNEMVDSDGNPVNVLLNASRVSTDIGFTSLETSTSSGQYNLPTPVTVENSVLTIDLGSSSLKKGSAIGFDITLVGQNNTMLHSFYFELQQDYQSVYQLVTSDEFKSAIGSETFHGDVADCGTSNQGYSLTDRISCDAVAPVGETKYGYVISTLGEGIKITAVPGQTTFSLQMIAMVYEVSPLVYTYEPFSIAFSDAQFVEISDSSSLHSNRDYSVGIIYMDEYGRSSTVLTSDGNSINVPSANSITKNVINVKVNSKPPVWASKYKFAVMPSKLDYETIYSDYYVVENSGFAYIRLEGDNQNKAKIGDTLIVKTDGNGPVIDLIKTEVLDIAAKEVGFLTGNNNEQAGLYMKVKQSGWVLKNWDKSIVGGDVITSEDKGNLVKWFGNIVGVYGYPGVVIPVNEEDPDGTFTPWNITEGSTIRFDITFNRPHKNKNIGQRRYVYTKDYIATSNYDTLHDFVIGQNIRFDTGDNTVSGDEVPNAIEFDNTIGTQLPNAIGGINKFQFISIPLEGAEVGNKLVLALVGGTPSQAGAPSTITASITLIKSNTVVAFETDPTDAVPGIYFEGYQSFDIVDGEHSETDINLDISDCYVFGNGVESYKIYDSLAAPYFRLGQRVSAVSEVDFKLANRYASMTYSGIYNNETNVNKLNEFNLALGNFKDLERSFGSIQKIHARQTDILILQEDKISYVLVEKNLLSDAVAGGAISSIPEVLGTQIARIEEFGISRNPESFVSWGFDKYFTDAKRGVVIKLSGGGSNESLELISNYGMHSWFRDIFINSTDARKLGGYDPYMNEYVLSSSIEENPTDLQVFGCGAIVSLNQSTSTVKYLVDFGSSSGVSTVDIDIDSITSGQTITVAVNYNGVIVSSGQISSSTSIEVNKSNPFIQTAEVTITLSGGEASYNILAGCPVFDEFTLFNLCVSNVQYKGQVAFNESSWNGVNVDSIPVVLLDGGSVNVVSYFSSVTGPEGFGVIPAKGSTMVLSCNESTGGTFKFDPNVHKFKFLVSNTLYTDPSDILANSIELTSMLGPTGYYGQVLYSNPSNFKYIYLTYQYTGAFATELCYSDISSDDACCNCGGEVSYPLDLCYTTISETDACCNCDVIPVVSYPLELCFTGVSETDACCNCDVVPIVSYELELCFTGVSETDACCNCNPIV